MEVAGPGGELSARVTSSFVKFGERTRFTVALRPGETTIVSWKKLTKDAAKAEGGASSASDAAGPHLALEPRHVPEQPATDEDAPPPNRFSSVIEKIERLYMGKDSSDEEDLDHIPDDDQYDSEDSFIDDAELDEYFEVDKSKTKHDGYFVNRGKLEKLEPLESLDQHPKKKRRKEMAKASGDNGDGQRPNKHIKAGKKGAGKSSLSTDKGIFSTSQGPSLKSSEDMKFQNHQEITVDGKFPFDPSPSFRTPHGDACSTLADSNNKQKAGIVPAKYLTSKLKEASDDSDRREFMHKVQSLQTKNFEESETAIQQKDKGGICGRIDLNLPDSKESLPLMKTSLTHKKENSSSKPKANALEKAIRELEKMVAESRPPALDAQDGDPASQSIKRRLPRDIKLKLAKVARLAHASNGKVPKELLNRLMGILGHLMQIRTLKRHLKIMMNTSLSVKQEKDDKFQQIKNEVTEMIKTSFSSSMSKGADQQSGGSGDFQESSHSDKALKTHLSMDATLEDKICDLYDIFVDGLDEDAAPQVRKLYAELAELWPKGVMDNHGIKRAICRAKERKRTLNEKNKDQAKIRRKKPLTTATEETARIESSSAAQSQFVEMRSAADPSIGTATQQNRLSATTTKYVAPSLSIPSTNAPYFEQLKGTQDSCLNTDGRTCDGMSVNKKAKKRAEKLLGVGEALLHQEKLSSYQGGNIQKQHKHATAVPLSSAPHKSSYDEFRFEPLT